MDSAQLELLQAIQSQLSDIQSRISAIERNQAVLKSSTESHFTTLSATATAHQNTLKSLEYTIADIHHESRETSARLNLLVNGSRKHYTRITQVPDELIAQIFAWINPKTVLKYKRISKSFRATLSTKHFAIANLKTFRYQLSSCWQTWLVWPKEYQDEFVERTCRFKTCISLLRMPWYEKPYRYGSFPERICTLQNLTELIFERQRLTGCIPPAICELKQLHTLVLSRNRFQGPIPEQLGTIPALKILDLCYNLLDGVIPVAWECEFLERLILSHNFLTGEIPSSICNLKHLEILRVNSNQLTGEVPAKLNSLNQLSVYYAMRNTLIHRQETVDWIITNDLETDIADYDEDSEARSDWDEYDDIDEDEEDDEDFDGLLD